MADSRERESRAYWIIVPLIFLALIFSEWRAINYQFWGARSVAPVDLVFLAGVGWLYYKIARGRGCLYPLKQVATLWYLLLPVASMFLLYSDQLALNNVPPSFTRYALAGLTVYMLATALLLSNVSRERLLIYVLGLVLAALIFYAFVYIFTRFIYWKPFIYGAGTPATGWTPALNFPFGSPSHAALFLLLNLVLGVGTALALGRYYLLYLMTPALVLCIFQTGSRSLAVFLVVGAVGFYVLILLRGWLTKTPPWREMTHLFLSGALASASLFLTLDMEGERALSIFRYSPIEMASGKVDSYRAEAWSRELSGTEATNASVDSSGTEEAAKSSVDSNGGGHGTHNAYLDLWLNWGKLSALSFLAFILIMLYSATKLSWSNRSETHYPLYAALLVCVGVVLGAIYANPLLHLKFVWIFFGLAISLQLNAYRDNGAIR